MKKAEIVTEHQSVKFSHLRLDNTQPELYVNTSVCLDKRQDLSLPIKSDFYMIGFVNEGEVTFKFDLSKERVFRKNDLIFVPPMMVRQVISKSPDINISAVAFTTKFLLQIGISESELHMLSFFTEDLHHHQLQLSGQQASSLSTILTELQKRNATVNEHVYGENILKHLFIIFLYEITAVGKDREKTNEVKSSRKLEIMSHFSDLLNTNFKKEHSVRYYADKLAITPKYLTELVHDITGNPPSELIHEKLVTEMKFLLRNPAFSVGQIAESLSFSDQSAMGKFFKRYTGISPKGYRHSFL